MSITYVHVQYQRAFVKKKHSIHPKNTVLSISFEHVLNFTSELVENQLDGYFTKH